jgi:hypothetical protein
MSDAGLRIFFDTREPLVASDTDTARDVYVADVVGYARPKSATTIRSPLVPAFVPCTAPDRTHGPPLGASSCNPPVQSSSALTVGAPDANGQVANSVGFVKYRVLAGVPGGVDDSDVSFLFNLTDVRVKPSLADYAGQLQATTPVRITDRMSGASETEQATGSDVDVSVTVPCVTTGSTTIGSTCSLTTTLDAVTPGLVPEGKRSVWGMGQVRVNDGGPDGLVSTTPNTLFAIQGVFVP